jgi:hypothetical protein
VGGLYRAFVVDAIDPASNKRLRVRIPQLFGQGVTSWIPAVGNPTLPNAGDAVWIMFEAEDIDAPVWLGKVN